MSRDFAAGTKKSGANAVVMKLFCFSQNSGVVAAWLEGYNLGNTVLKLLRFL